MAIIYDIPRLIEAIGILGYTPRLSNAINRALRSDNDLDYNMALREATVELLEFNNVNIVDEDEIKGFSDFFEGVAVFQPVFLENEFSDIESELFLENAVVSINQSINVIVTNVQGSESSVKEHISNGDFEVTIKGMFANKNRKNKPIEKAKAFKSLMTAKKPLKITNEWLNDLGIFNIVITSWGLPNTPFKNCAVFELNAISDMPIEITESLENAL